jgi:NAD(P)-dependent dehydrogenase (short-subunit alcohol dehydrogenase family)
MKTIIITGGSSGIGRATALHLANLGHNVIAIARDKNRLLSLKQENGNIEIVVADIATEIGRATVKDFIKDRKIDVLINNAGLMAPSGNLAKIELAAWRYQMAVNVEAPLFLTTSLLENLKYGRVLNITIYSSFKVNPGLAAYGISKAALNMLTEYMRQDFRAYELSVGLVLPGIVATEIQKQLPKDDTLTISGAKLAKEGKLLSTEIAAKFLSWLILETTDEQFSNGVFDIYDKWHQQYWSNGAIIEKPW